MKTYYRQTVEMYRTDPNKAWEMYKNDPDATGATREQFDGHMRLTIKREDEMASYERQKAYERMMADAG